MRRIAAKPAGGCLRHTGHSGMSASCPLYLKKQTLVSTVVMSVLCQFETLLDYSLAIVGRNRKMNLGLRKDHKRSMIFTSCGRNFSAQQIRCNEENSSISWKGVLHAGTTE